MTQQLPTDARPRSAEPLLQNDRSEIAPASRVLLGELEASLEASQRALLSRDVACLEELTGEQIRLRHSLEIVWSRDAAPGREARSQDPAAAGGLRAAQLRVLHLGRVQAALLTRAERWLTMVSNLLAGPTASYAPLAGTRPARQIARPWPGSSASPAPRKEKNEEGDSCRA